MKLGSSVKSIIRIPSINHLLKELTDTIFMSAEERKKTGKVQMICPGCLTVFTVINRDSGMIAPKCHYCKLPLEEIKYSR